MCELHHTSLVVQKNAMCQKKPHGSSPWASMCCRPTVETFLFKDPGSVLKRGEHVCQRQVVNEVLGPLITEFVRNFGREDTTSYQRSSNASLLVRIWAVKLIRHNFERHVPSPTARYPGG